MPCQTPPPSISFFCSLLSRSQDCVASGYSFKSISNQTSAPLERNSSNTPSSRATVHRLCPDVSLDPVPRIPRKPTTVDEILQRQHGARLGWAGQPIFLRLGRSCREEKGEDRLSISESGRELTFSCRGVDPFVFRVWFKTTSNATQCCYFNM